ALLGTDPRHGRRRVARGPMAWSRMDRRTIKGLHHVHRARARGEARRSIVRGTAANRATGGRLGRPDEGFGRLGHFFRGPLHEGFGSLGLVSGLLWQIHVSSLRLSHT